jgi:hypothetical protein
LKTINVLNTRQQDSILNDLFGSCSVSLAAIMQNVSQVMKMSIHSSDTDSGDTNSGVSAQNDRGSVENKTILESHKKVRLFINFAQDKTGPSAELAELMKQLDELVSCLEMSPDFSDKSIYDQFEKKLKKSDVMVVIWTGNEPNEWVIAQFSLCQRIKVRINPKVKFILYALKNKNLESLESKMTEHFSYLNIPIVESIEKLKEEIKNA